jgi:hypothetical protein
MVAVDEALIALAQGGVYRSTDDGQRWRLVHATETPLTAVASRPDGQVAVVGYGGTILTSTDAGLGWQSASPTSVDLKAVTFTPGGDLWAVGDDGVLVRSGAHAAMQTATVGAVAEPPGKAPGKASGKAARKSPGQAAPAPAPAPVDALLRPPSPIPTWSPPEPAQPPVHTAAVTAAAFLDEGRFVTGDAQGQLLVTKRGSDGRWSTEASGFEAPEAGPITELTAWGELVFLVCQGKVHLLDLRHPEQARVLAATPAFSHLSARGGHLAAAGQGALRTWRIQETGVTEVASITLPTQPVSDLDLSLDGSSVAVVLNDAMVEVHDVAGKKQLGGWKRAHARIRFTRGGDRVYLSANTYDLRVVSTAKGGGREEIRTHNDHRRVASCRAAASGPSRRCR